MIDIITLNKPLLHKTFVRYQTYFAHAKLSHDCGLIFLILHYFISKNSGKKCRVELSLIKIIKKGSAHWTFYDIMLSNIYSEITSFIYKGDDNMSETNKPDNKDNNNYIIIPANNSIKVLSDKLKSSFLLSSSGLEKFKKSINIKPANLGINDGFRNTISELAKQQLSLSSLYFNKSVFESMTNSLSTLAKKLTEMHTTMKNELLRNINPFFKELSKSLEEARKNPHSF